MKNMELCLYISLTIVFHFLGRRKWRRGWWRFSGKICRHRTKRIRRRHWWCRLWRKWWLTNNHHNIDNQQRWPSLWRRRWTWGWDRTGKDQSTKGQCRQGRQEGWPLVRILQRILRWRLWWFGWQCREQKEDCDWSTPSYRPSNLNTCWRWYWFNGDWEVCYLPSILHLPDHCQCPCQFYHLHAGLPGKINVCNLTRHFIIDVLYKSKNTI